MVEHQALYRKWRPQQFAQVVDQTYPIRTLINALSSNEVGHAYLFAGPRGTGKTTVARLFAKAVNCRQRVKGEPCNRCDACDRIARGASLDVIEVDGASNRGIDQIRKLREEVNFVPADVKYKVYIIDEVHMLTHEAFNALLKTLEEPPKRVVFIFATTEAQRLPATVISRCQAFEFTRIPAEAVAAHLDKVCKEEGIEADARALEAIAARCGGALRDALVTLEQLAAFTRGKAITGPTLETVLGLPGEGLLQQVWTALLGQDAQCVVDTLEDLDRRGRDLELFLEELIRVGRRWLVRAVGGQGLPVNASPAALAGALRHLLTLKQEMGRAWDKHIWLEVGLVQWAQQASAPPPSPKPAAPVVAGTDPAPTRGPQAPEVQPEAKKQQAPPPETGSASDPAPSAPSAPPDAGEPWKALLQAIRNDRRVAVYAYLVEAHPQREGDRLHVLFDAQRHCFHKESLEKAEIQSYLKDKVRQVYGDDLTLVIGFLESGAAALQKHEEATAEPAPAPATLELDEKAALVKKVLGAKGDAADA